MPTPYYLNPKRTKLPAGHDDTLDPSEDPVDSAVRVLAPNTWPARDTSPGPRGPRDRPAGPPPTDPARRSVPAFDWPRFANLVGLPEPDLDPDIALWPVDIVNRWPFTGPPTTGVWPLGWFGIDNTATPWICTAGGAPGTWAPLGGSQAVFTPDDFGAKGDGVTDDSVPIQAAINAASAAAGSGPGAPQAIVQGVQGKTYAVTFNGAPITGTAWATQIIPGMTMAPNVCIQNVAFTAPQQSGGATAIIGVPNGTNNWTVRNCSFFGNQPLTSTIEIFNYAVAGGYVSNATFSDNYVTQMGGGGCALAGGNAAGPISNFVRYERNYITLVGSNPLKVNTGVSYCYIRANYMIDCLKMLNGVNSSTECIILNGGPGGLPVSNCYITGNFVRNFQGIYVGPSVNGNPLTAIVIADNYHLMTSASTAAGIHGPQIGNANVTFAGTVNNAIVRNNIVDFLACPAVPSGQSAACFFVAGTTLNQINISGNVAIMPPAGAGQVFGIYMSANTGSTSGGLVIANNNISNISNVAAANAIRVQFTSPAIATDMAVTGNNCVGLGTSGMGLNTSSGPGGIPSDIVGNSFVNCLALNGPSWQQNARVVKGNAGWNPYGPQAVAVPASGTAITFPGSLSTVPFESTFVVTASTSTVAMAIHYTITPPSTGTNQTITVPASSTMPVRIPPGCTVTPTYTAAPTWVWAGE